MIAFSYGDEMERVLESEEKSNSLDTFFVPPRRLFMMP